MALTDTEKFDLVNNELFRRRMFIALKKYLTNVVLDATDFVTPSDVEQFAFDNYDTIRDEDGNIVTDAVTAFASTIDEPDFLGSGTSYAAIEASLSAGTGDSSFADFVVDYVADVSQILKNRP